ncbi:MAG: hypothetical protein R3A51_22815 [Nannocystaceae bacterium]|nr:hypothetical protein [Myxococcales bacterium]
MSMWILILHVLQAPTIQADLTAVQVDDASPRYRGIEAMFAKFERERAEVS